MYCNEFPTFSAHHRYAFLKAKSLPWVILEPLQGQWREFMFCKLVKTFNKVYITYVLHLLGLQNSESTERCISPLFKYWLILKIVCPMLLFCKHLSLVVLLGQRKRPYFWPFGRFRIEGQKQQNSDFQSHFSMSKIHRILFFSLKNIKNGE